MMTRERKIIISVGVLLLLVGGVYRYAPDYGALFASNQEIELKKKKLAQHQRMTAKSKAIREAHNKSKTFLAGAESTLLAGTTPALAAVDAQNIIKGIAYKTGIEIASFQVMTSSDKDVGDYVDIPVRFQITSTIRQLKDILYGIEASEKILTITDINAVSTRRKPKPGEPVHIRAVITVAGYMATY